MHETDDSRAAEPAQFCATVCGLVQGVNFRHYTRKQARALGLTGYVQNLSDGSVCVVAQGRRGTLLALLQWLRHGPSLAEVAGVDVRWESVGERYGSFEVHY